MTPETDDLDAFLRPTPIIDSDDARVADKAQRIVRDTVADPEATREAIAIDTLRAKALFEWVRDEIPHSYDIRSRTVTCSASDVLAQGTGICFAKSHLLAAMCRAVGIPAGLVYQRLRRSNDSGDFTLHGLNAIYLESLDRWIRVDPRGNKPGVDARFSLDEERLAFPSDTGRGEQIIETIFIDADPAVAGYLQNTPDLIDGWDDLPDTLTRSV